MKIYIGVFDLKRKKMLPKSVEPKDLCESFTGLLGQRFDF